MRKPKLTGKRVLGAVLAAALAVAGTVAIAGGSQAATAAAKVSPASGSAAGGDTIIATGKGFMDSAFDPQIKAVRFLSTVCGDDATAGTAATAFNVTSATKVTVTTPALAAGTWYLCLFDGTGNSGVGVLGQAKYVTGTAPAISTVNGLTESGSATAGANDITASSLGGTPVTVVGTDFSKKSVVYLGTTAAKTTYVSATKLTAVLPSVAAATDVALKVASEYGSDTTVDVLVDVSAVISVSPNAAKASTVAGVELTGKGLDGYTFGSAVNEHVVVFIPAGTTLTAGTTTIASLNPCTNLLVESDTTVICKTPNNLSGAYTVRIVKRDGTTAANYGSAITAVSRSATFTAADI